MAATKAFTETEIRIIERDAAEQRALSAELNTRTGFVLALFAVSVGLAYQSEHLAQFPIPWVFVIVSLAGVFFLVLYLVRGEDYRYTDTPSEWIDSYTQRAAQLSELGYDVKLAEQELHASYWQALVDFCTTNREANRNKSRVLQSAGRLSVFLILLVLVLDVLARAFAPVSEAL